jgi:tripartite-type tricarboxylate transporter receptor subunit TctC
VGPKGLPPEIVKRVHAAVQKALAAPEVRRQIEDTGSQVVGNRPEDFAQEIAPRTRSTRRSRPSATSALIERGRPPPVPAPHSRMWA